MNISNKKIFLNGEWVEITPAIYRTAEAITLEKVSFIGNTATVMVRVKNYLDAEHTIQTDTYPDSNTALVINNSTLVDKRTGLPATPETPPEYVEGEFDFFYTQKMYSIQESLEAGIMRADSLNRFDESI